MNFNGQRHATNITILILELSWFQKWKLIYWNFLWGCWFLCKSVMIFYFVKFCLHRNLITQRTFVCTLLICIFLRRKYFHFRALCFFFFFHSHAELPECTAWNLAIFSFRSLLNKANYHFLLVDLGIFKCFLYFWPRNIL